MSLENQGILLGEIDSEWASQVGEEGKKIWEYNGRNAEEIYSDVSLQRLGGLVVDLSREVVLIDEVRAIGHRRSIVNLAFDQPGLLTNTESLYEAALEQRGEDAILTRQLEERRTPTRDHGANETWVLPVSALELRASPPVED